MLIPTQQKLPINTRDRYWRKLLRTFGSSIVGYWPLWEASGSVATDMSGNGYNGTYANVTLAQSGVGDDKTSASFNGSTSVSDIYSAGLASAFNGAAGTLMIWAKVSAAGVWTDGTARGMFRIRASASNFVSIERATANNWISFIYLAGGTNDSVSISGLSSTGWVHYGITWDLATANAVTAYINGAVVGTPSTTLGTWVGLPNIAYCCIGSQSNAPAGVWSGFLAHGMLLNRPATAGEIATVAFVG